MNTKLTNQEKEFFKRHQSEESKFKIAMILITALLAVGVMLDGFNGFYIIRQAKSLAWGVVGLFLLSIFYLIGEAGSEWINSKDDVSHPLYKRAIHLALLLGFGGALTTVCVILFSHLGWEM